MSKSGEKLSKDTVPSHSLRRRLAVPVAGAAATALAVAGIAVLPKVINPSKNTKHGSEVTTVNKKKALVKELKTAYVGPIAIKSAKNTGEVRSDIDGMGDKRAVVQVKIGGTAINHETADNRKTPTYHYIGLLEQVYLADDPSFGIAGVTSGLNGRGVAEIYPRLDNFTRKTPVTLRYVLGVGAGGELPGGREIDVIYNAGEVDVTGSRGRVTSLTVVPPQGGEATPQLTEATARHPLVSALK